MDFALPPDHLMKITESEMREKYSDLARELRKLCNMKGTLLLTVIGTVPKGFEREMEQLEIGWRIQTTALLRSARILRIVLGTWRDLLSLRLDWKSIS